MLTDPKKIGARLSKCADKMGITKSKDETISNIPYGIDQSSVSRWLRGKTPNPKFAAFCTYVGMSFDDTPAKSVEKFVPEGIDASIDAKMLEGIIHDLVELERRGYPMQVTAAQLRSVLNQGEPAPVLAGDRSMLEGLDTLAIAQIQKGLGLVIGSVPGGSSEYTACMHALQSVGSSVSPQAPRSPDSSTGVVQSQPQVDEKSS